MLKCICKDGISNLDCPNYEAHKDLEKLIKEGHAAYAQTNEQDKRETRKSKEKYINSWYKKIMDFYENLKFGQFKKLK